jgi:hypothetical protein
MNSQKKKNQESRKISSFSKEKKIVEKILNLPLEFTFQRYRNNIDSYSFVLFTFQPFKLDYSSGRLFKSNFYIFIHFCLENIKIQVSIYGKAIVNSILYYGFRFTPFDRRWNN